MTKNIYVPGEPRGKGRGRGTRFSSRPYKDEKTRAYEEAVALAYTTKYGDTYSQFNGPVGIIVIATFGIPKSASNARKQAMENRRIRPTKAPDADNIVKIICDGLNGVAFHDDRQVVDVSCQKYYGSVPGVQVVIYDAGRY